MLLNNLNHIILLIFVLSLKLTHLCAIHVCELKTTKLTDVSSMCHFKKDHLICHGGIEVKKFETKDLHSLTLCDWPDMNFDPERILQHFSDLQNLSIINGSISNISSPFPVEGQKIKKLEIIGTKLQQFQDGLFKNLSSLRILDLRYNNLSDINPEIFNLSSLKTVYLFGNPWKCRKEMEWILESSNYSIANKIDDKFDLQCSAPYDGRPLVPVVEILVALNEECKRTVCECQLTYVYGRVDRQIQKQLMAFVSVNCSNRGLTEMPPFLPANTTVLQLSGNEITDLTPLKANPVYKRVLDLYLDYNLVETVSLLDGSYWLENFRLLSLRNNKLTDLPTYALEHVLPHSINSARLYLGNNPWRCDCLFTPGFQDFLIRFAKLVKDINDIRCSRDASENSNKQIRDLKRTEICITPEDDYWLPLDIFNVILVFLIFLVIGKLLYDYWCFKRTGKLPWIVTKIP